MLINIALFALGLAIGLLACSIYTRWQDKQFIDLMASNHDFLERYADDQLKNLDEKYSNLDSLNAESMKLVDDTVQRLVDISEKLYKHNLDNGKQTLEAIEKDRALNGKLLEALARFVKESEEVNTSRWELIEEYILNEDNQDTDYCVTCRHNVESDMDTCLTCSEGAKFKYDPEHVYLQTEGMVSE